MMKKSCKIYLIALLTVLAACVDTDYHMSNLDATIELETELVAPLAYSKLQINDMLNDELNGMEIQVEGEDMYLVHTDSQYLGNDLIDRLEMLPTGSYTWALQVGEKIEGTAIMSGQIIANASVEFDGINNNPNERLDSVLFADCDATVTIRVIHIQLAENSYLDVQFSPDTLLLDTLRYPGNKIRIPIEQAETTVPIHLNKAMLRLNGGNKLGVSLRGVINAASPFVSGDEIDLILDFNSVQPHITYMNIGTARDIYKGEKSIDFNYTADFQQQEAFFPFYDPQIHMSCINNIGVPVRYYIDYVEAIDTRTGEKVRADFGGTNPDTTSIVVATPSFEQIKDLSINELMNYDIQQLVCQSDTIFDRYYGHTDRLFKINPNKLTYHYRIRSIDNNPHNVHFFFHNSDMALKEQTKLPLWFEGDAQNADKNFFVNLSDTVAFGDASMDLGNIDFSPQTKIILKLSYKNFLPVGIDGAVAFLDANNNKIMQDAEQSFYIESGAVNSEGYVSEETVKDDAIRLAFTYEQAKTLLSDVKNLQLTYKIANEKHKTIRLRTNDWLEFKAHLYFDGALVFNQEKVEE